MTTSHAQPTTNDEGPFAAGPTGPCCAPTCCAPDAGPRGSQLHRHLAADIAVNGVVVRIDIAVLGGFEVRVEGRAISSDRWSRRRSAALVKLLAMTPGRSLHREQVIDALWPDLMIDEAAPRLHKAAHYARRAFGYRKSLVLTDEMVRLCPHDDVHVDALHFGRLAVAAAAQGGAADAKGALAVYGGDLLPMDVYEPWTEKHREHLRRLHLELLRQAGDWHQVLAADRTDEQAHLALVRRYAESGDRPAAMLQLGRLERALRTELGLELGPRARAWWGVLSDDSATDPAIGVDGARRPVAPLFETLADLRRLLCAQIDELGAVYGEEIHQGPSGRRKGLADDPAPAPTRVPAGAACAGGC